VIYVKGQWPDGDIPSGEPEWIYYEVAENTDVVCRIVAVFPEGHATRNSMELAKREGPDQRAPEHRSLVHGSFLKDPDVKEMLIASTKGEFDKMWNSAMDKPRPE